MYDFIKQNRIEKHEKNSKFVNIVFVLQIRIEKNDIINHIFIDVCVEIDSHIHNLRIIIDFDVIENFVNQLKIKNSSFQDKLSSKQELKTFNKTSLCTYHTHSVRFEVSDFDDFCHENKNEFIEIDMNEIEMILKLSWLQIVNFDINWTSQTWRRKVNARASRVRSFRARYNESQITNVNAKVFRKFCMKNDFQTYVVQTTMLSLNANDKQIVSNNSLKMKLFFQYFDFAKVFKKKTSNILF
jgi:hypothetical protein